MVLYGDSHALMWLPAFDAIARSAGWRLVVLAKVYCPAEPVTIASGAGGRPDLACDQWHTWATRWINASRPNLLVITQFPSYGVPGQSGTSFANFTQAQWLQGFKELIDSIHVPGLRKELLGTTPSMPRPGPECLAAHSDNVQLCSTPALQSEQIATAEHMQALATGIGYISPVPWFCSAVCTAVIDKYNVYLDGVHISATWAQYLENVLARSLGFPPLVG